MKLYRTILLVLLMCVSTTFAWSQSRIYPVRVNAQLGEMTDRYTGKLILNATVI